MREGAADGLGAGGSGWGLGLGALGWPVSSFKWFAKYSLRWPKNTVQVKDLIPDLTNFYNQYKSIEPWLKRRTPKTEGQKESAARQQPA